MADTTDWYVVFKPAERETWFTRFLHADFGHCYMVRHDGYNWLRMSPNLGWCAIEVLPEVDSEAWRSVVQGTVAVYVEVPAVQERIRVPWLITLATCTEACKAVLGVRAWWVITPRQLFNYLMERKHERWWRRGPDPGAEETSAAPTSGIRQGEGGREASLTGADPIPAGQGEPDERGCDRHTA